MTQWVEKLPLASMSASWSRRWFGKLGFLLLVCMIPGLTWQLWQHENFPIRDVRVSGDLRQLSVAELQASVRESLHEGFFHLSTARIRDRLLVDPWVKEVSVQRVWPDQLHVHLVEKTAFAQWGEGALLTPDAEFFVPPEDTFPDALPRLYGPENSQAKMLAQLTVLRRHLHGSGLRVRDLRLSDRFSWSFQLDNGFHVLLGKRRVEERMRRFSDLLHAGALHGFGSIRKLDFRYPNGFAVNGKEEARP